MTEQQMSMVVSRLDRIDRRLDKISDRMGDLESETVTWKTLLIVVGTMAAVITAIITAGNALWGG